jgi:hypothetical protein
MKKKNTSLAIMALSCVLMLMLGARTWPSTDLSKLEGDVSETVFDLNGNDRIAYNWYTSIISAGAQKFHDDGSPKEGATSSFLFNGVSYPKVSIMSFSSECAGC